MSLSVPYIVRNVANHKTFQLARLLLTLTDQTPHKKIILIINIAQYQWNMIKLIKIASCPEVIDILKYSSRNHNESFLIWDLVSIKAENSIELSLFQENIKSCIIINTNFVLLNYANCSIHSFYKMAFLHEISLIKKMYILLY